GLGRRPGEKPVAAAAHGDTSGNWSWSLTGHGCSRMVGGRWRLLHLGCAAAGCRAARRSTAVTARRPAGRVALVDDGAAAAAPVVIATRFATAVPMATKLVPSRLARAAPAQAMEWP